jgi:hypothetical protein
MGSGWRGQILTPLLNSQMPGHKDLRMAARYQHLSPAFLADGVEKLDGVFGEACHHSITSPEAFTSGLALTAKKKNDDSYGI